MPARMGGRARDSPAHSGSPFTCSERRATYFLNCLSSLKILYHCILGLGPDPVRLRYSLPSLVPSATFCYASPRKLKLGPLESLRASFDAISNYEASWRSSDSNSITENASYETAVCPHRPAPWFSDNCTSSRCPRSCARATKELRDTFWPVISIVKILIQDDTTPHTLAPNAVILPVNTRTDRGSPARLCEYLRIPCCY
ncbi:hypothetical protein BJV74DRAFT_114087 [Russula compacta]|nr:hypothetical protein BJV74DRAFT_114087 [Russula compacta]